MSELKATVELMISMANQEVLHGPSVQGCIFCASFRLREGLNMDLNMLKRYTSEGDIQSGTLNSYVPPHIVIPLCGWFEG